MESVKIALSVGVSGEWVMRAMMKYRIERRTRGGPGSWKKNRIRACFHVVGTVSFICFDVVATVVAVDEGEEFACVFDMSVLFDVASSALFFVVCKDEILLRCRSTSLSSVSILALVADANR